MEILFLFLMCLKGLSSLLTVWANLKLIKPENSVVSDFSEKRLSRSIKYHGTMAFFETIFACLMVIPLVSKTEDMKYIFVGLLILLASGAIEDFAALLTYRRELARRRQTS
ncbi:MAG: hypothetical protein ACAF41_13505 [Leptolyngbya sp. BL-A-14]